MKTKEFSSEISIFKDSVVTSYGEGKKTWEKMLETMTNTIISTHSETIIDNFKLKVNFS